MAKKQKKAAPPGKPNLPKADFYLYKPEPRNLGSLRAAPKEKAFVKKRQTVAFYNGNDNPIRVSFLGPLQVDPTKNPLTIKPGRVGKVTIDPVATGEFPCEVEILLSICPTCHSKLKASDVLSPRPENLAMIDPAALLCCPDESGGDDADPIIIIKPQGSTLG